MGVIVFNGTSSTDLHVLVQHPPEYAFPEKDCETTHVPGRNGDIVIDTETWKNVNRVYSLAIDARKVSYTDLAGRFVQWLHSASGYARLEDSYEPDYYRMALYKDASSISNIYNKAGEIELTFECKPQRFLKVGEKTDIISSSVKYYNPTGFSAKPKIVVRGSGSGNISIGDYTITVNQVLDGMTIDCESLDAYCLSSDLPDSAGSFTLNDSVSSSRTSGTDIPSVSKVLFIVPDNCISISGTLELAGSKNLAGVATIKIEGVASTAALISADNLEFNVSKSFTIPAEDYAGKKVILSVQGGGDENTNKTLTAYANNCQIEVDTSKDVNCNSKISVLEFPKLVPGYNQISFTGGITSLEITPRWWTL